MHVDSGSPVSGPLRRVGRYALFDCVGHGATATVHIGRLLGPAGFSKTVAIKRMHENVGRDPEVAAMFLDEARLSGRIRHPNVVATTDLLAVDGETFLVMEYVHGDSLSALHDTLRSRGERMPPAIAVHVMRDVLHGLHAAHEATDEAGDPLGLVHRDVSPHNIQLGIDGSARVLDFGIAKALGRLQDTLLGQVKGKLSYMAPEQLLGQPFDHRVDIFAAGIVLWEMLAGRRLFFSDNPGQTIHRIMSEDVPDLRQVVPGISSSLAQAVARATSRDPALRFATAFDFARELESATELVSPRAVGEWLRRTSGERLERRAQRLKQIECTPLALSAEPRVEITGEHEPPPFALAIGPDEPTRSDVHEVHRLMEAARPLRPSTATPSQNPAQRKPSVRRGFGLASAGVLLALGLSFAWLQARPNPLAEVGAKPKAPPAAAKAESMHALAEEPATALPSAPLPRAEDKAGVAPLRTASARAPAKKREKPAVRAGRGARANSKAQAKAPKPPARRAEDLFSRN